MKKSASFLLLLCLVFSSVAAETVSGAGDKSKSALKNEGMQKIKDFFYECWKYEITGNSDFPEIEAYCGISSIPARTMTLSFWGPGGKPMRVCDIYYPEKAGFFDAFDYYNPGADNGDWISSLEFSEQNDFTVQPPVDFETAQEELEEFSEVSQEDSALISVPAVLEQDFDKMVQKKLRNYENFLRLYSIGEERLSVEKRGDRRILVNSDGKKLNRKFFDDSMRLLKKENWNISGGLTGSSLISSEEYDYGEGTVPVSCTVIKGNEKHILGYNEAGLVVKSSNYSLSDDKWQITSETRWKFDDKKRVVEKSTENFTVKLSKTVSSGIFTEKYSYRIEDGNPDYSYFENGQLKLKTEYSSAEDYVMTTSFDGGFVIETYYEKGIKKKDLIYLNGELRRTRVYE